MLYRKCDVAVIGGGIVGLAAADELIRRGVDAVCFEAGRPGGGQSAGPMRLFRHAHDGVALIDMARRARQGWLAWEERAGKQLLGREGALVATEDAPGLHRKLMDHGVASELVPARAQPEVLPLLAPARTDGVLDTDAGTIAAETIIECLASWLGTRLVCARALGVRPERDGATVTTSLGPWHVDRVLVCAGSETPAIARTLGIEMALEISRHSRLAFRMKRPTVAPCWVDETSQFGEQAYGGPLPSADLYGIGLRSPSGDPTVSQKHPYESGGSDLDPTIDRIVAYVAGAFPGLDDDPVEALIGLTSALTSGQDAIAAWQEGPVTCMAGANLFKFAPLLGALLAEAVQSDAVPIELDSDA